MKLHPRAALLAVLLSLASGTVVADEATIRSEFSKRFPKATIESVTRIGNADIYEILVDGEIFYSDGNFNYLFDGALIDPKRMVNLTDEAKMKKLAIPFDQLPLELAFKKVKGNGSRKMAVFSDPDCPYCKRLEQSLASIDNVTIYTFLYPLEQLHPNAPEVARSIWCSPDKVKAWDDYMLRKTAPKAAGSCKNPVDTIVKYGQDRQIKGTPTLFFTDGTRVPGAIPLDQIEAKLAKAQGAN